MPNNLVIYRHQAFLSQSGRCYYCGFEMWESNPDSFAIAHKITLRQAHLFKCTAEHLDARKDGGMDSQGNIVAACAYCNHGRHKIKNPPEPDEMRRYVKNRLAKGLWTAAVFNRLDRDTAGHPSAAAAHGNNFNL